MGDHRPRPGRWCAADGPRARGRSPRGPLPGGSRGRGRSALGHRPGPIGPRGRGGGPAGRGDRGLLRRRRGEPGAARGARAIRPQLGRCAGDAAAEAAHAAAHRSTAAWPALAALALERADPATSVTFVSVAASRLGSRPALLGPQPGVSPAGQTRPGGGAGGGAAHRLAAGVDRRERHRLRPHRARPGGRRSPGRPGLLRHRPARTSGRRRPDGDWNRGSALRFALPWGLGCRATSDLRDARPARAAGAAGRARSSGRRRRAASSRRRCT